MSRQPRPWVLCALLAAACSAPASPRPIRSAPDFTAPSASVDGVAPPSVVAVAPSPVAGPPAAPLLQISWPDLRDWLGALPSTPIPFTEQSACEDAPVASVGEIEQSVAGARIIASVERDRAFRPDRLPLDECAQSAARTDSNCRTIDGYFDSWVLSFDVDGRLIAIERDHLDSGCGLGVDGAPTAEALLATDAVLHVFHRSTWNPNDELDYDGDVTAPSLGTGGDARRALYEAISRTSMWRACATATRGCISGVTDDMDVSDIHWRADGSAAIVMHSNPGSPSATTQDMAPWARRELRRFRGMLAVPFVESSLPAGSFERAESEDEH